MKNINLKSALAPNVKRARAAFWPIVEASVAAMVAYLLAMRLWGHQAPYFAAICAWVCLSFTFDRDIRRVGESALGVTLGIALGDLIRHVIGPGWWQLAVALVLAGTAARFLDKGLLLASQAGSQAMIIAAMPVLSGSPYSRVLDGVTGGFLALTVALLTPYDPRKKLRVATSKSALALAKTAVLLSDGLAAGDPEQMAAALQAGRDAEPGMATAITQATTSYSRIRGTINGKYRPDIAELRTRDVMLERSMRSLRLLAHRMQFDSPSAPTAQRAQMASFLQQYATAASELSAAIAANQSLTPARQQLEDLGSQVVAATNLDPAATDPGILSGYFVLRAIVGNALAAVGATREEVLTVLPPRGSYEAAEGAED